MPGPYINQAPVDDTTDMGDANPRPKTDPQTMGILQRILSLLEQQITQPPPMPLGGAPDISGMLGPGGGGPPGMPPGMGMGGPPPMGGPPGMPPGMGQGPPPMPGPGMPPPMPSPGMPPPGGGGGMPMPPGINLAGTGGLERGMGGPSPFEQYAQRKLQGMPPGARM